MPEVVALAFIVALQHPAAAQKAPQRIPPCAVESGPDVGAWRMRHHARVGEEPVEEPSVARAEAGEVHALLLFDKGIQAPGGQPGLRQGVS